MRSSTTILFIETIYYIFVRSDRDDQDRCLALMAHYKCIVVMRNENCACSSPIFSSNCNISALLWTPQTPADAGGEPSSGNLYGVYFDVFVFDGNLYGVYLMANYECMD